MALASAKAVGCKCWPVFPPITPRMAQAPWVAQWPCCWRLTYYAARRFDLGLLRRRPLTTSSNKAAARSAAPKAPPPPPPAPGAPVIAPSAYGSSSQPAPEPSVAIATYDPKTGQFATPDGGVYRQTEMAAGGGPQSWQDMLPTG